MPDWLIRVDWIIAVVLGIPSGLAVLAVAVFYLFRPGDASMAGLAGYMALFVAILVLAFAGLFALAAWGGSRQAQWAPYVQVLALLSMLLPVMVVRNWGRGVKRSRT